MIALRVIVLASLLASYFASAAAAQVEPAPRLVVIVGAERATGVMQEAVSRLRGELSAAGLLTILRPSPSKSFDWRVELEQVVHEHDAVAAIGIASGIESPGELWVHDRSLGRTVVQPLQRPGESTNDLAPVVAVRSVEFVRANLASLDLNFATRPLEQTAPPPSEPWHEGWGLGVGIHWLDGAGAVSPALAGVLSLVWATSSPWVVELRASGWGPQIEHTVAAGRARVRHSLLSSQVAYRLVRSTRLELGVLAAIGAYRGRVSGESAGTPFTDRTMSRWAFTGQLGGAALLWLHTRLCLRFDLTALATLPPIILRVGNDEVGRMASPALLGTVGAMAVF